MVLFQFCVPFSVFFLAVAGNVWINEIAPAGADFDWVELFNDDLAASADLAGFRLVDSDNASSADAFRFPSGASLAPRAFMVVGMVNNASSHTAPSSVAFVTDLFRLKASGETLVLAGPDGAVVDRVIYVDDAAKLVNGSVARLPDGGSSWLVFDVATRGVSNELGAPSGNATVRNAEWHDDSHGKHDVPLYDEVFDIDTLQKLEIEFEFEQWNASWAHMINIMGEFGAGGGGDGGMVRPNNTGGMGNNTMGTMDRMPPDGMMMPVRPNNTMDAGNMPMMGGGGNDLLGGNDPIWVWCTIRYRGRVWRRVGFRWKGNSSLRSSWSAGYFKLPFRLDMDEFEDEFREIKNMRLWGFKKLTFSSNFGDGTGMREMLMQEIYRQMDVPSARGSPVQVWMDIGDGSGLKRFGIYTMIEDPGASVPPSQFADTTEAGNIYKPDGQSARLAEPFDSSTLYLKLGEEPAQYDDVRQLVENLHADTRESDVTAWRADLERVFDVPVWLRYLAVTRSTENWDQYGAMTHNYYLYCRLPLIPCTWVTWDGNFVLGSDMGGIGGGGGRSGALDLSDATPTQWPLIAFTRTDSVYYAAYLRALERLLSDSTSPYAPETLDAFMEHFDGVYGAEISLETFPYATLPANTANNYVAQKEALRASVVSLRASVAAFLAEQGQQAEQATPTQVAAPSSEALPTTAGPQTTDGATAKPVTAANRPMFGAFLVTVAILFAI